MDLEHFNSQPHEEADECITPIFHEFFYFNSQPHEEADDATGASKLSTYPISTHSLTKRLTLYQR